MIRALGRLTSVMATMTPTQRLLPGTLCPDAHLHSAGWSSFLMNSLRPGTGPLHGKGKERCPDWEAPCWTLTCCVVLVSKGSGHTGPVGPEGRPWETRQAWLGTHPCGCCRPGAQRETRQAWLGTHPCGCCRPGAQSRSCLVLLQPRLSRGWPSP